MKVLIYNINSAGGNYEYALALLPFYKAHEAVKDVTVLMPSNAPDQGDGISRTLKSDKPPYNNKWLKKGYFLYRSVLNPLILYRTLRKQEPSIVVLNDFDQLTAFLWAPFLKRLKKKHVFLVMLHDPDRDNYLPVKAISVAAMRRVMSVMHAALYHQILPKKEYYNVPGLVKLAVPHGIYAGAVADAALLAWLQEQKGEGTLMGIIGNIRDEKNYMLAIETLSSLTSGYKLLIAGNVANSGVDTRVYKSYARKLKVEDRLIWVEKYLSNEEMDAAIVACDLLILYYKPTFTSQSGVLNKIAPYKKRLVVSETKSALTEVVSKFQLGVVATPESSEALTEAVLRAMTFDEGLLEARWNDYAESASWSEHVRLVVECINENFSA